jgi:hypothetical protein
MNIIAHAMLFGDRFFSVRLYVLNSRMSDILREYFHFNRILVFNRNII